VVPINQTEMNVTRSENAEFRVITVKDVPRWKLAHALREPELANPHCMSFSSAL
jgi:hypothetical protein